MAAELIGGREFYVDAKSLTSGTTSCTQIGRVKGMFTTAAGSVTLYWPSGATLQFTPSANSILPFAPDGITFASGSAWGLY